MDKFDPNNITPASNRERIAYHEAGHAVVTWALCVPLLEIQTGEKDGFSQTVESDEQLRARLGDREWFRVCAIISLAGEFAQKRWEPKSLATGCRDDGATAHRFSWRLAEFDGREWPNSYLDELRAATETLVATNWPRIEALAIELLKRGTIPGDEAVAIIEHALI